MLSSAVKEAYQSSRLRYIRINEQDEDARSFICTLFSDPEVHALTASMLLRPVGKSELDYLMREFSSALLGVLVCLIPDGDKKPRIIGELIIGEGGIPSSIAHNRTASIGLAISAEYQGKGYGREALDWAVDWAFRHGNLHTLGISTVAFNTRAAKMYQDMGFVAEGRRRQVVRFDRAWHDELLFSMTEDEWEASRRDDTTM